MILDSMQVKRDILNVTSLEVGRGGLHKNRPGVLMIFDLYFSCKNGKKCSLDNLVLISMLSSLSLELPLIMWKI